MPHSIEAEQSVVGAMLMDKDAITTAGEIISGDDFYQASYGVIFDSMIELFNEGKPVDLITLQERLKEKDVPAEIATLEFVRDLVTAVPTSANVKFLIFMASPLSVILICAGSTCATIGSVIRCVKITTRKRITHCA